MILRPQSISDVQDAITAAARSGEKLEVRGGGSKSDISAPDRSCTVLDTSGFAAIIEYDPSELVLTVGAGASLAAIQSLIADHGQMLAFEPFDHGPIFGRSVGAATIGGVIAAGVSGSRRLSAGAVRDHVLGFEAVSGRAERFIAGGRVVKNVTGYDLPKLLAGSWGQLAVMTQVTLKVLPRPREFATVVMYGLDDDRAIRTMSLAMRSQAEVAAAAYVPDSRAPAPASNALPMMPRPQNTFVASDPIVAMRLEGFGPSVAARVAMLRALLAEFGHCDVLSLDSANAFWSSVRDVAPLNDGRPLWRISVAATHGPSVTAVLLDHGARWFYDWAGGLVWLTMPIDTEATLVRAAAEKAGGHAMLVRASPALRSTVPALHPELPPVAALAQRIKAAFDPASVLDPYRFTTPRNAD